MKSKIKKWLTAIWFWPMYALTRLIIFFSPTHPFHKVKDIWDWIAGATPLLRQYNTVAWMQIVFIPIAIYIIIYR